MRATERVEHDKEDASTINATTIQPISHTNLRTVIGSSIQRIAASLLVRPYADQGAASRNR